MSWLSFSAVTSVIGAASATILAGVAFAGPVPDGADLELGETQYNTTCVACHGKDGTGALPGVADFTVPGGPLSKSDDELFASIVNGVNTPGAALTMPARGGNPALSETDVRAIVAYLRAKFGK